MVSGKAVAGIPDGRPDAILAFFHSGIGQSNRGELGQTAGNVHLNHHRVGIDSYQCGAAYLDHHGFSSPQMIPSHP
jgi:hypothetical protein